jgi:hypothetical protein
VPGHAWAAAKTHHTQHAKEADRARAARSSPRREAASRSGTCSSNIAARTSGWPRSRDSRRRCSPATG